MTYSKIIIFNLVLFLSEKTIKCHLIFHLHPIINHLCHSFYYYNNLNIYILEILEIFFLLVSIIIIFYTCTGIAIKLCFLTTYMNKE